MLLLLFQIGEDRYALDTASVLEVVPWVTLKRVARAPVGVAGLLDYHAAAVPVLDLRELTTGERSEARFSTRLILVKTSASAPGMNQGPAVVGLLAERATGTLKRSPADFVESGLSIPGAPYLGPVIPDEEGFIQFVRLEGLFDGSVRTLLGGGHANSPALAIGESATP